VRHINNLIAAEDWYLVREDTGLSLPVAAFGVIEEDGVESVQPLVTQDDRLVQTSAVPTHTGAALIHLDPKRARRRKGSAHPQSG